MNVKELYYRILSIDQETAYRNWKAKRIEESGYLETHTQRERERDDDCSSFNY